MPTPTERELQRELEAVRAKAKTDGTDDVTVDWGEAAPDARPEGMTWEADADRLTYDLWGAQRDCLDALGTGENDIVAFLAGYGSGKSVFGARWLLAQALAHPGSRFLAMGVDFQKARVTTYPKLFAQLPGDRTRLLTSGHNGPESSPIVADFNRGDHRLTLTNDATITLGSADDEVRYAGAEFGAAWLDEPSLYGDALHELTDTITTRFRGVAGPKTQLWTLTGDGYNAAWEILEQQQEPDGEPIGLNIEVIRASTFDNPYLTEGDIERFKRKFADGSQEDQALHGQFAAATGLVYSDFTRDTHLLSTAEAEERAVDEWRIYGYDAGWRDPRVMLEIRKTDYGQLVVLDEFHESESHVDKAIRWLGRDDRTKGPVYAEHEPDDIRKFRRKGYRAVKAKKAIDPGIADVRRRLETDADGRVGLLVAARCEHLTREFLGYKEEHVGSTAAVDHCLDALRYAIHTHRMRRDDVTWGDSPTSSSASKGSSTVIKSGSERTRRLDQAYQRLRRSRSVPGIRRTQSR